MHAIDNKREIRNNGGIVTTETIDTFSALAVTLKRIHIRLIAEGYEIREGRITKSDRLLAYEQDNIPPRKNK